MSWRDILGTDNSTNIIDTHNSQNTHKSGNKDNSADIANCAEEDSELFETLANACKGLAISPKAIRDALAPEDIEEWQKGENNSKNFADFAYVLTQRREMDLGKRPSSFIHQATCKYCGPIWLWIPGNVSGCPWCKNRASNHPIPRPESVRCTNCKHFNRTGHPHLGHCAKGEPEAIAGLWNTDQRDCDQYQTGQNKMVIKKSISQHMAK